MVLPHQCRQNFRKDSSPQPNRSLHKDNGNY